MAMSWTSLTAGKTAAGSLRRWVNNAELDVEQVLDEAQALLFQTLRVREMRAEFADLTMAAGDAFKALPSGFLDPISLVDISNGIRLGLNTEAELHELRGFDIGGTLLAGPPTRYAIWDEKFQFDTAFTEPATLKLIGFRSPAPLAANHLTNFLTDRYPHLLRTACMAAAYDFLDDDRLGSEVEKLAALIARTNAESDLSYRGLV